MEHHFSPSGSSPLFFFEFSGSCCLFSPTPFSLGVKAEWPLNMSQGNLSCFPLEELGRLKVSPALYQVIPNVLCFLCYVLVARESVKGIKSWRHSELQTFVCVFCFTHLLILTYFPLMEGEAIIFQIFLFSWECWSKTAVYPQGCYCKKGTLSKIIMQ